jgi:hypothetical protein
VGPSSSSSFSLPPPPPQFASLSSSSESSAEEKKGDDDQKREDPAGRSEEQKHQCQQQRDGTGAEDAWSTGGVLVGMMDAEVVFCAVRHAPHFSQILSQSLRPSVHTTHLHALHNKLQHLCSAMGVKLPWPGEALPESGVDVLEHLTRSAEVKTQVNCWWVLRVGDSRSCSWRRTRQAQSRSQWI